MRNYFYIAMGFAAPDDSGVGADDGGVRLQAHRRRSRIHARGNRGDPTAAPTPAPGETAAPTAQPTEAAGEEPRAERQRGTLRRLFSDPPTLDPHLTTDATSATVIIEVFGGLVTISPDLRIVPDSGRTVGRERRRAGLHLPPGKDAVFHNGKPITAHDFKWSLERAADAITESLVVDQYLGDIVGLQEKLNGEAREVQGVRVIDDHTLEITIKEPKSYFIFKLTYPTAFVLDRENVESGRRWVREPNGSGPFKLAEYVPGERMILEKNPNYHLGPAHLERVELILSGGTSMLMYENDEIDITGVGIADLDRLLDPNNNLNAELEQALPSFSTSYIGMNVTVPPFDDVKVRQALNYAVNRQEIASLVLGDLVTPARGILPPGFPAYNNQLPGYPFNPDKAQQLLSESKYADNISDYPIILTVPGGFGASVDLDLESITHTWQEVLGSGGGIPADGVRHLPAGPAQAPLRHVPDRLDCGLSGPGELPGHPVPQRKQQQSHPLRQLRGGHALLERARTETDQTVRYDLYKQAEEIIVDEAPWIPLWHAGEQYVLVKPYVKDYYLTQLIVPRLRFVRIDE